MVAQKVNVVERLRPRVAIADPLKRELLAEFGSTFLLIFIGTSIVAQFLLKHGQLNTWIHVNLGWGFAIAFCIYTAIRISGAHMNPAISLLFYTFGHLSFKKFILYSLAQTAGAFFGAAAMYGFYHSLFDAFDGGNRVALGINGTAGAFTSFPGPHLGPFGPYLDQAVGTGILAFFLCVLIDERNEIPHHFVPLLLGFVVMMIGTSFGVNLGYPINPARDLGPRLFAALVYGGDVFQKPYALYWLAPVIGPLIGAPLAGWIYQFVFGFHLPDRRPVYRVVDPKEIKLLEGEE